MPLAAATGSALLILAAHIGGFGMSTIAVGAAAGALVIWAPAFGPIAACLFIEETLVPGGHSAAEADPLIRLGSSLYGTYVSGVRIVVIFTIVCALSIVIRHPRDLRFPRVPTGILSVLAVWSALLAKSEGYSIAVSIGAASSWLMMLSALTVGAYVSAKDPPWLARTVFIALLVKATVGAYVYLTGGGIYDVSTGITTIYYDSATSYVAMGVLLAVCVYNRHAFGLRHWLCVAAAALIILESMRRNVLAAGAVDILAMVAIIVRRVWVRLLIFAALGLTAIMIALTPTILPSFLHGMYSAVSTLVGAGQDSSTLGHVSDFTIGLAVAEQHPALGLNVFPPAQFGLVVENSPNLYIHNEFLQDWVRFGIVALIAVILLVAAACRAGLAAFAEMPRNRLRLAAAFMLVPLCVPLFFFALFTSDVRWQVLTGVSLGVLSRRFDGRVPGSPKGDIDSRSRQKGSSMQTGVTS